MEFRNIGLGIKEITPKRIADERGFFSETWQRKRFVDAGIDIEWVQENHSFSAERYVLRGLHLQASPMSQAKLVRVLKGRIYDVSVDVRVDSPSFGKWVSCNLSADAFNQVYIPSGFAHGFLTLETEVEVLYKTSSLYHPDYERRILWSDEDIAIDWPLPVGVQPILSDKDCRALSLAAFANMCEM